MGADNTPSMGQGLLRLRIVVNGHPTAVDAYDDECLHDTVARVLEQTHNIGQPPFNWELRDADGGLLLLDRKVEAFDFSGDPLLFLNLKAGIGAAP